MASPGTVVELKPPTDARIAHRPVRQNLERLVAKAEQRRDAAPLMAPELAKRWPSKNLTHRPLEQRRIYVRPYDHRVAVLALDGTPYPPGGLYVPVSDVYAQRRLRDGSLVRADPPETGGL